MDVRIYLMANTPNKHYILRLILYLGWRAY